MAVELRCESKLHGIVDGPFGPDTTITVGCDSRFCGAAKGVSVRHRFRMNGSTLAWDTRRFKSVTVADRERRSKNAPTGSDLAVRTP